MLDEAEAASVQALSPTILPSDRAVVVLKAGSKLYQRLLRETRAINLPGCDPTDDQIPDPDDEPAEFVEVHPIMAAAAAAAGDEAGAIAPRTTAAHALQFRTMLRHSGEDSDDDGAFDF